MNKLTATLLASASLIACSSSPNDKNIEEVIKAQYENCEFVKPDKIKKTNGYEKENNIYTVEYIYNLILDSDEMEKIKNDYLGIEKKRQQKAKEYYDRRDQADAVYKELREYTGKKYKYITYDDVYNSLSEYEKLDREKSHQITKFRLSQLEDEREIEIENDPEIIRMNKLISDYNEYTSSITKDLPEGDGFQAMKRVFPQGCTSDYARSMIRNSISSSASNLISGKIKEEEFYKIVSHEITGKVDFQKTENGWVIR